MIVGDWWENIDHDSWTVEDLNWCRELLGELSTVLAEDYLVELPPNELADWLGVAESSDVLEELYDLTQSPRKRDNFVKLVELLNEFDLDTEELVDQDTMEEAVHMIDRVESRPEPSEEALDEMIDNYGVQIPVSSEEIEEALDKMLEQFGLDIDINSEEEIDE